MRVFNIKFGTGLAWVEDRDITVEDFQCEQDAVDKMIDFIEFCGDTGFFLTQDEIDSGEYGEDEYVVGGNHGRYLHHHGYFEITEIAGAIVSV